MRSVGFDSPGASAGFMTATIHAPRVSRPRLHGNTDFFAFLCRLLTPPGQHLCQRVVLLPEAPMTPDPVPHDSPAPGQAREARRRRLIFAALAAAVLVAVIAWAMKPGSDSAGRPGGRDADAGRPIPVRAVAASTGSVDVTVEALGTAAALEA